MNKKGFTLIELLAVIIILGILMIIAIPSVTTYINNSRKEAYVDTAKEIISGARNLVNDGKLEMFDTDTTYYIDQECIGTENASKSPYGEFTKAYVVVTYNGKGYDYYWTSVDDAGQGIRKITKLENLDIDKIESDLNDNDIPYSLGVDGRSKYMIIDKQQTNCGKGVATNASGNVDGETGIVEKRAAVLLKTQSGLDMYNIPNSDIYIVRGGNPSNYVYFNCDDNNRNCQKWRIIGVYGNKIKIIKEAHIGFLRLDQSLNVWDGSELERYLNSDSEGGYYYSLKQNAKDLIIPGTWYVGATSYNDKAQEAYTHEKETSVNKKVGLMEGYEFLYATGIESCYTSTIGLNYNNECGTRSNDWLNLNCEAFVISPNRDISSRYSIMSWGRLNSSNVGSANAVFPVVYLNSSVKITGGSGTQSDPYTLGL